MAQILGQSSAINSMLKLIKRVAPSKTNVLIIGESGTGKELVAKLIHESGPLKGKPFVPVNCGAIPENLIESELFGHKKGSFTGAVSDKPGLFEVANGGSIFLDEIGELPLSLQAKLLRAIQEHSFRRVGGNDDVRVDVRVIAATNRNLEEAVKKKTFREDLYYRLNVILITTPPLRDRKDDIPLLAKAFLERSSARRKATAGPKIDVFEDDVLKAFMAWGWPGNVRELENVVERAVTLEQGPKVSLHSIPTPISEHARAVGALSQPLSKANEFLASDIPIDIPDFSAGNVDLKEILKNVKGAFVEAALRYTEGDVKKAAKLIRLTPAEVSKTSPKKTHQKLKKTSSKK